MFNAPLGADGLGHAGWAYSITGTSNWIYGATEDTSASSSIPAGPPTNDESWYQTGTFAQAITTFTTQLNVNGEVYHDAGYYTSYRCAVTTESNMADAWDTVLSMSTNGYDLWSNNCLTKGVMIIQAYDPNLIVGDASDIGPNEFYENDLGFYGFDNPVPI
jgi:hypothetical protein